MKIFDMHCDTLSILLHNSKQGDIKELRKNNLHIDLEKMKQSGYLAQNFAIFIAKEAEKDPFQEAIEMIDLFYLELDKNKDTIAIAKSYTDIINNDHHGLMSAILTLEEGAMIKGSLANLRTLYRLGARMMTLTWNYENELASPNYNCTNGNFPDPTVPFTQWGLTDLGIATVEEMERLGMIIDVSHLSDAGFYDILKYTKRPFVASHSNARSISSHVRNMSDDMIRKLSDRGGVMGLNFYPGFLADPIKCPDDKGSLSDMVAHIKHIDSIGGIECIALGTDFDGIEGNEALPNASHMDKLYDALQTAGYSEDRLDKIFYQNVLRVYKEILN